MEKLVEFGDASGREDGEMDSSFGHFGDEILGGKAGIANGVLRREAVRGRVADQNTVLLDFESGYLSAHF